MTTPRRKRVPPARTAPLRAGTVCEALEQGVRTAYAVIDEYMRRGYQAARDTQNTFNTRGYMNDNRSNFDNRFNPWGSMPPMGEQWMAAMRAWADAFAAFLPGGFPQPWAPPSAGYCAPQASQGPLALSVHVSSTQPIEVSPTLNPGCELIALSVDPLQGQGFAAPPIDKVTITKVAGNVRVSVTVPADQPAGCYRGAIRKTVDGCIAGDLTVTIGK
jgi:hypothetical protein